MDYQLFPILAVVFAVPAIGVIFYLFKNRQRPGTEKLAYLMISVSGWLLFNTLELIIPTENGTLLFGKLTYIFIVSSPVCWLYFVLDYHGHTKWLRSSWAMGLWVLPVITVALILTNDQHGWIWKSYWFVPVGSYLALKVSYGTFFWVHWFYSQLLILIGMIVLIYENVNAFKLYRWQVTWISIGLLIVMVSNALYVTRALPWLQKDYTSIAMAAASLCFAIGISRYRLFDVVPLERSVLFDSIDDGVLAIDTQMRLVDINPAGIRMLDLAEKDVVGKPIREVLPSHRTLIEKIEQFTEVQTELLASEDPLLYLDVKVSLLHDRRNGIRGLLVLVRDVTRHRLVQISEKESHEMAEALRDTAAVLNSSLDIDQVLDHILANLRRIIPCDSADITMIEEDLARTVRSLSSKNESVNLPVLGTPSLMWMIEHAQPLVIPTVKKDVRWLELPELEWIHSYMGAPIIISGEIIGFLNLNSATPGFYNERDADHLKTFANQAAIALQNASLFSRVNELATIDSLTGLNNRRNFFEVATREINRAIRYGKMLSLVMIDLDEFKQINDRYGHLVGDHVLQKVSRLFRENFREFDICGRYGGDEFTILLPEIDSAAAAIAADRLRQAISELRVPTQHDPVAVTASMGVAELQPDQTLEGLLHQADVALYEAKEQGRDSVVVFCNTTHEH